MGNKKTKSLKRPAKRIFTGNRFTQAAASAQATAGVSEAVPVVESASKRKPSFELPRWIAESDSESDESSDSSSCSLTLRTDSASSDDSSLSEDNHRPVAEGSGTQVTGDRLVNLSCLQNLISAACVCKNCRGKVVISEDGRWGLASTITISCCSEECLAVTSLPIVQKSGHFFPVQSLLCAGSPCYQMRPRWSAKILQPDEPAPSCAVVSFSTPPTCTMQSCKVCGMHQHEQSCRRSPCGEH